MPGLEIILAAVSGITTLGGAVATYRLVKAQTVGTKAKEEMEALRYRFGQAVKEIEARHVQEDLFCAELENIGAGSANSVKIDFRNRVETMGFNRPSWKPSRIKDELRWVEEGIAYRSPAELDHSHPHAAPRVAVKQVGPIQQVIAGHLDRILSGGDENARIRPLSPPVVETLAPAIAPASKPATTAARRLTHDVEV